MQLACFDRVTAAITPPISYNRLLHAMNHHILIHDLKGREFIEWFDTVEFIVVQHHSGMILPMVPSEKSYIIVKKY